MVFVDRERGDEIHRALQYRIAQQHLALGLVCLRGLRGVATLPDGGMIVAALGNLWELEAGGALRRQITNDPYADADPAVITIATPALARSR